MRHQVNAPKIVQEKDSWFFWVKIMAFIIVFVLVSVFSFDYGRERAGFDVESAKVERKRAKKTISELEDQIDTITRELSKFERSKQVDVQSVKLVKRELKKLMAENVALKEKIAFFKGIVAPEEQEKGISIQSFQIKSTDRVGKYQYRVILSRFGRKKNPSVGVVKLTVEGLYQGKAKLLTLKDLSPKKIKSHAYSFQYYKAMSGQIVLPEGFRPSFVEIVVDPKGSWPKPIKEKYSWLVSRK